ncbi:MAG: tetratricopeptide repeat protein [Terriglobales bacterium]
MDEGSTARLSENETKEISGGGLLLEGDAWEILAKYFRSPKVLLTTLILATAVLYSGTLFFDFVWDDGPQIVDNPLIRSWHSLSRVFVSDLWYHTARQQVYYRPFFVAWSIVNYGLAGLRPWGWHLGAILLHIGAMLSVFWLARKLGMEYWTAALATVIFALHPIHIECVAWISAAADSMVTMFAALAFGAFLKAREPDGTQTLLWRLASLALLACALLTKEMAVSFTGLVGIYIWLCPGRSERSWATKLRGALAGMVPYALVTIGYIILRKIVLRNTPLQFDPQHGYVDMVITLPHVLALYLRQLVLPIGLTGLYYTPYVTSHLLQQFALPVLLLLAVFGLIYVWARKTGDWVVAFAGCWLFVSLAPALYLRNFGNGDFVRDRYVYLSSIGFCILVAKALRLLPSVQNWSAKTVQGAAVLALCCGYVAASIPQQAYWDSDLLITLRGHELYPENSYASIGLARQYSIRGAHDRAIALVEDAARRDPDNTYTAFALAEVYIAAGRKTEGRKALEYALRITPGYEKSETGMASVAALWGRLGDYDRAFGFCTQALAADPELYSALYNCGNIELMTGHYGEAARLLQRAVQVSPQLAAPRHFLGRALLLNGQNVGAQPYLRQAAAMDPGIYDYHYWLGQSFEKSGDKAEAFREYSAALQIIGDSQEAKIRLTALETGAASNGTK